MEKKETSGRCSHAVEQAGPAGTEWLDSSGRRKKGEKKEMHATKSVRSARTVFARSFAEQESGERS